AITVAACRKLFGARCSGLRSRRACTRPGLTSSSSSPSRPGSRPSMAALRRARSSDTAAAYRLCRLHPELARHRREPDRTAGRVSDVAVESQLADPAAAFVQGPHRMLIGGEWVDSASGQTFATIDPATGEEIAHVPYAEACDVDRAVAAARKAFDEGPWTRKMTAADRGAIVYRVADLISG